MSTSANSARRTPLYDEHVKLHARIIDFAGWDMPVQYKSIIDEHRAVRSSAGMFDSSHMRQIEVSGDGAAGFFDSLVPNDVAGLTPGYARYTTMCNESGGIIDDLMIYRLDQREFLVVVNAGGRDGDLAWIREHAPGDVTITPR